MLLAVGFALGGYCGLLAWRRPAQPPLAVDTAATASPPLPAPTRLAGDPNFGRLALAANDLRHTTPIPITVRLRGVDPGWRTESCGVAISSRDGGSGLVWLPLTAATLDQGTYTLQHRLTKGDEILVAVAASRACALHGYLTRSAFTVSEPATLDIDASATRVAFRGPGTSRHLGPLRIVRSSDAHWVPMAGAAAGLVLSSANDELWLGQGSYELCDPIRNEARQRFDVPGTQLVEISASLARTAADRP